MKKSFQCALALLAVAAFLAGCSNKSSQTPAAEHPAAGSEQPAQEHPHN